MIHDYFLVTTTKVTLTPNDKKSNKNLYSGKTVSNRVQRPKLTAVGTVVFWEPSRENSHTSLSVKWLLGIKKKVTFLKTYLIHQASILYLGVYCRSSYFSFCFVGLHLTDKVRYRHLLCWRVGSRPYQMYEAINNQQTHFNFNIHLKNKLHRQHSQTRCCGV